MTAKHKKTLYRIIVAAILFAAVYASTLFFSLPDYVAALLFFIPYAVIGYDILWRALRNILHGQVFDENFLMSIATIGAFGISEYPEAVIVMLFYQVGELFQSIAVGRSRRSIASLMDIRPDHANVLRSGIEQRVAPDAVSVGETIIIRPGERIPLDGVVIDGRASVNMAALTGESLPRDIAVGENVMSGSVNIGGVIKVRVSGIYTDSAVARILRLVESVSAKKARSENFITRFARVYTPVVVLAAVLIAIAPPLLFSGDWADWINRALIFLVVSCPCALVISVPLSFFGGIGGASRRGILIKGSNYLESLSKVNTVVFDKTGTLTVGSFTVTAVHTCSISESELLDIAALAESYSNHPIAESIIRAHSGHIDSSRIGNVEEFAGLGVKAVIDGKTTLAGNSRLMQQYSIEPVYDCICSKSQTGAVVHIAVDGAYCGHIVISDVIKPSSAEAVKLLKSCGIKKTIMLTGDLASVGNAVGERLGVDEIHAELLPSDKVRIVESMLSSKQPRTMLAFVGDGVNDAPVLALSDVGIAMGALGSDAAIEAADVVLTDDEPKKVAEAIRISRRTMRIVRQNIVFALSVKAIVLALGAMGLAGMWIAVFADVGVSVIAILNATRSLNPARSQQKMRR